MDATDFRLLVALHEDARQSYRALGRRVSLTAPAVRDRLARLRDRGILQGYMLSVEPSVLDRDEVLVFFAGDYTRDDALRALAAPDVGWVAWKLDGGLTVQLWPKDSRRAIEQLAAALGARPSGHASVEPRNHRPVSSLEWRIVDALIENPRMPMQRLTESTGLSPKTVRKHLNRLLREQVLFISPRLGALADAGELVYTLAVFGKIGEGEVRRVLGDAFLVNEAQDPPAKYLLCRGIDLGDVMTRTAALGKVAGVTSVSVTLNREMLLGTEFLRGVVRERIERRDG